MLYAKRRKIYYNRNAQNQIIGQYIYDGDGKRVKKISNAEITIFVYDAGGKLASEYTVSASSSQAPQTSYLTEDHLGSPRVITDNSGNVVSRHDYMAFGEEIARANYGTDSIRDKYTGYERDNESSLDFAQARYYNSRNGRFTSVDPLTASASIRNPQTFNRYSYGLNSPYKFTDPLGLAAGSPDDWEMLGSMYKSLAQQKLEEEQKKQQEQQEAQVQQQTNQQNNQQGNAPVQEDPPKSDLSKFKESIINAKTPEEVLKAFEDLVFSAFTTAIDSAERVPTPGALRTAFDGLELSSILEVVIAEVITVKGEKISEALGSGVIHYMTKLNGFKSNRDVDVNTARQISFDKLSQMGYEEGNQNKISSALSSSLNLGHVRYANAYAERKQSIWDNWAYYRASVFSPWWTPTRTTR